MEVNKRKIGFIPPSQMSFPITPKPKHPTDPLPTRIHKMGVIPNYYFSSPILPDTQATYPPLPTGLSSTLRMTGKLLIGGGKGGGK